MTSATVDVSVKGKIIKMRAFELDGKTYVVSGRWLKFAAVYDEEWTEGEPGDLVLSIAQLKARPARPRADIFTFVQKLPDTTPQYAFPVVLESVAAIRMNGYEEWLRCLSRQARQDLTRAAKRGVVVRTAEFDDDFVKGIVGIYNESSIRQGRLFWHYGKAFDAVKEENATYLSRSVFLGAYLASELIGFVKIVRVGKLAVMMQIVSESSHPGQKTVECTNCLRGRLLQSARDVPPDLR